MAAQNLCLQTNTRSPVCTLSLCICMYYIFICTRTTYPLFLFLFTYANGAKRSSSTSEFEYVVQKQEQAKICFGSGRPRDTSSRKGMTFFMKTYTVEEYPNVSPNSYDTSPCFQLLTAKPSPKSISKRGYSGLARYGRPITYNEEFPAPCDYDTKNFLIKRKQSINPFSSMTKRKSFVGNNNPGPGMYAVVGRDTKRNIIFNHNFGGRAKMRLGVALKCCQRNTDVCSVCGEKPFGDYWHLNEKIFLCRSCMIRERREHRKYSRKNLSLFQKLRDCSEIHLHEGTKAKMLPIPPNIIQLWNRQEAYLSAYFKD